MADDNMGGTPSPSPAPAPAPAAPSPSPAPAPSPTPTEDKKTIATGGAPEPTKVVQPTFGDSWRKDLAGDDDKTLKRLDRFASPKDLLTSYLELDKKLNAGPVKPTLPENATDEQKAEFRKQIGVPEAPDKYDLTLPGGLVPGEADKPIIDNYLKYAFDNNISNDLVKANLGWYLPMARQMEAQQEEADKDFQVASDEAIHKEWGGDYKANINIISGLLEGIPDEEADALMLGRTADGKIIGDDPRMLKLLARWGREINPVHTVVPNSGAGAPQAIADELANLTKMSGDKNSDYWHKDKGPALQQRMRDLLEAQDRLKKQGKAA